MSNEPWGPPPPSGPPAGGTSPSSNRRLVVALGVGLGALLLATVGVVRALSGPPSSVPVSSGPATSARPTRTVATPLPPQSPTAAPPSRQPTSAAPRPSPTSGPSTKPEPPTPKTGLKGNSLYRIDLADRGSCRAKVRRPKPPLKNSALAPYLRTLVKCLVDTFRTPLAQQGFRLVTPKVKTFSGSITTPCGKIRSSSNPAFYCANTIYWPVTSDDAREAYTFARLGYVGLTAHEFGHHLQATTDMLYDYNSEYAQASRSGRNALSRRLELQAQCFEGVFLGANRTAIHLTNRDLSEIRSWHSYTGDEDPPASRKPDHGTSKAQLSWLERGLAGANFGRCNTWSASFKSVK